MVIDSLRSSFLEYVKTAHHNLFPHESGSGVKLIRNRQLLLDLTDELELRKEFGDLVFETGVHFQEESHKESEGFRRDLWRHPVQNFFRRSACYLDFFEGKEVVADKLFEIFVKAFTRTERTALYLAPLEFVEFSCSCVEFNSFQIRSFQKHELENLLGSRINEVFYPWASSDLKLLQFYWFICASETIAEKATKRMIAPLDFDMGKLDLVRTEHVRFPRPIESALKKLILFEWQTDLQLDAGEKEGLDRDWCGFGLPFVIRTDDDLLASPRRIPNLDVLDTEPIPDSATGEEVGKRPVAGIYLDDDETKNFSTFVRNVENLIEQLPQGKWNFIDTALDFMTKAFFSNAIDQLLWHITAIEALLGRREKDKSKKLRQRLGAILAEDKIQRQWIQDQFKELYDFRSALVHGDSFSEDVYVGHLRRAREFARKTVLWFLHFLNHILLNLIDISPSDFEREEILNEKEILKEILNQIDISDNKHINSQRSVRISRSLKESFNDFPYVKEWSEP